MRAPDKDRTRATLMAAGERVAGEHGLASLSIGRVIEEANSSKGSFFHHFTDRTEFVLALHRAFHDRVFEAIAVALEGLPPGRERIVRGARAYWDFSLSERAMRAFLIEARVVPAVRAEAQRRSLEMAKAVERDLRAMRVPASPSVARLVVAMVTEVALAEADRGRRSTSLRSGFDRLVPYGAPP